jgi:UDP-N-acetylmuramate dehydrogenase
LAEALQGTEPSPQQVSAAVCRIRREKLPDPQDIPNAGSFFKNPVIEAEMLHRLLESNASMPYFQQPNNRAKVPAAWLIDQCGFRGLRSGNVGVHQHQALVLVNFGGTGAEILHLARQIQEAVQERFMIALEIEPQIYGLSEQPG